MPHRLPVKTPRLPSAHPLHSFTLHSPSMPACTPHSNPQLPQAPLEKHLQLLREKMEGVNAWLHASGIPRPLKRRIRDFYAG